MAKKTTAKTNKTDGGNAPSVYPDSQPSEEKVSWRSKAARLLASRRSGIRNLDPAKFKARGEERGTLLTHRLEAATSGRTTYPPNVVRQWEFELQAIMNGTWTPGMERPKNKEFDKLFYSVSALGPSKGERAEAERLDELITTE